MITFLLSASFWLGLNFVERVILVLLIAWPVAGLIAWLWIGSREFPGYVDLEEEDIDERH